MRMRLLDRLVFVPTRNAIEAGDRVRRVVTFPRGAGEPGACELWGWDRGRQQPSSKGSPWVVLKFPGAGGRAERAGDFPAELLPPGSVQGIWTLNPPGYGASPGRPSLADMPAVLDAVMAAVRGWHPETRIFLTGNSLGCVWALAAATQPQAGGLLLRNPPPLQQMIGGRLRYNWWNFGLARWFAAAIPDRLDAIANARACRVPVIVIQSGNDRVVPVRWQQPVLDALAGRVEVLLVPGMSHEEPLPESCRGQLQEWFVRLFCQPGPDAA